VSTAKAPSKGKRANLDNLTLSRKEGWRDFTRAPKREGPEVLSRARIRHLSEAAADIYNQRRYHWHNNIGPLKTPQLTALHGDLWDIMDCNARHGNHANGAVTLSGFPGLGKSVAVEVFAKDFHLREIRRHGEYTASGNERWPVCRIGMRGTSMKDLNAAICEFYAHPVRPRDTAEQLGRQALDCVLNCETRLLIIDDVDFRHWQRRGGVEIGNHFTYIANEFPLALLSIGIASTFHAGPRRTDRQSTPSNYPRLKGFSEQPRHPGTPSEVTLGSSMNLDDDLAVDDGHFYDDILEDL